MTKALLRCLWPAIYAAAWLADEVARARAALNRSRDLEAGRRRFERWHRRPLPPGFRCEPDGTVYGPCFPYGGERCLGNYRSVGDLYDGGRPIRADDSPPAPPSKPG